jgi:adenylate kinase
MGPQGSGKGTVGDLLADRLEVPLIGAGELLRDLTEDHPHYEEIHDCMVRGVLVPNNLVAEVIKQRVSSADCSNGYILDGWGRQPSDLDEFDPEPDFVLELHISRETSIKRITGRRICTSDGKPYNIYTLPKEQLDECEGELVQRADDTEVAVNKRLDIYYDLTQKTLDLFEKKGVLRTVDAEGLPDEVFDNCLEALGMKS